jgi:GntR family transcriptional repressor for pyruvate dehydrogenase complex
MTGLTKPIEVRRLYQQIADQIRELIDNGEFPIGTRLPAERDLAQKLGVSRPSLREALIALEIEGSVDIRMGSGVYITGSPNRSQPLGRSLGDSPTELMQARAAIEGAAIVLSASRITDDALVALRKLLEDMRDEIEAGNKPLDIDRQFHLIIAEHSGNSILSRLVTDLFDERHSPISAQLRVKYEDRDTWQFAIEEHQAILDALEARDPLQAQAAMHIHLERSRRRWIETNT